MHKLKKLISITLALALFIARQRFKPRPYRGRG